MKWSLVAALYSELGHSKGLSCEEFAGGSHNAHQSKCPLAGASAMFRTWPEVMYVVVHWSGAEPDAGIDFTMY